MTAPDRTADELALRRLSALYAAGADRRSGETYAGVFLPDARVRVFRLPDLDTPVSVMAGRDELATVPDLLRKRYARTFHFVGQGVYEIGDDEATGEVYCLAHHLTADRHGGTSYVMHMRYDDAYRRDDAGDWKIAERVAFIDWTETRAANPPGT
jgi:SnoaL-like domain